MRKVLCSGSVTPSERTAPITACTASSATTAQTASRSSRPGARFSAVSASPKTASAPVATSVASASAPITRPTLPGTGDGGERGRGRLAGPAVRSAAGDGGDAVERGDDADLRSEEAPSEAAERLGVAGREELVRRGRV